MSFRPRIGELAAPGLTAGDLQLPRVRGILAHLSLAVVTVSGIAIAVLSSNVHSPIVQGGGRGLPEWIAGPFTDIATGRPQLGTFYVLIGVMCVAYLLTIATGTELHARWLVAAVVLLHIVFLLAPPIGSTDVFNYIDYARLGALHGLDPYIHGPVAAPHDPAFLLTAWRHTGDVYGPLFTVVSYPLAHMSVDDALWSFKAVTVLASLGCLALIWAIGRRLGRVPIVAAATFGLNPVLLVWAVAGAHNDVLMLALALAGLWLVICEREAAGGAMVVAAAAVKATAGVALPFVLIGVRRRWRVLAGAAGAAAVLYALSVLAFPGHPLGFVATLRQQHRLVDHGSVPNEVAHLLGLPGVTSDVRAVASVLELALLAWIALRVWRGYDWIAACGWAMVALVVTSTWFLGWYTVWPLPFAALSRDRRLVVATLGLQALFIANHIPAGGH